MIIQGSATDNEMVLEYLKAEVGPLIQNADRLNEDDNSKRAFLLKTCLRSFVFQHFPKDVSWKWLTLEREDLQNLDYLNCSPWRQLSGESLRVVDGASRVIANHDDGSVPQFQKFALRVRAIADSLKEGRDVPALILVEADRSRWVVIEGNHRATACVIADTAPIWAIAGFGTAVIAWSKVVRFA